jgi:hypothetical protein
MTARHEILGGKVQLYRRPGGRFWQSSTSIAGEQHRATTKKEELSQAEDAAEEWYLELRGMFKRGELGKLKAANAEKTFKEAAEVFLREFPIITEGQRNAIYVKGHERRLRNYIIPFLGDNQCAPAAACQEGGRSCDAWRVGPIARVCLGDGVRTGYEGAGTRAWRNW